MDSSEVLVKSILEDMERDTNGEPLDAIMITGDFVMHDMSEKNTSKPHKW
jgi:hypothetical protein